MMYSRPHYHADERQRLHRVVQALVSGLLLISFQVAARDAVFVLGADQPGEPAFYGPATAYYQVAGRSTDRLLVTTARTLTDVREVLQRSGQEHWDTITLVVHGTPWEGMRVDLFPEGPRALLDNVERVMSSGEFPPVADERLDARSVVRVESCGVGRRTDYLDALSRLLGGNDKQRPAVEGSKYFVLYAVKDGPEGPVHRRLELPVLTRVLPWTRAELSSDRLASELVSLRNALDERWPGAGVGAVWALSPVEIHSRVPSARIKAEQPERLARNNRELRAAMRAHALEADNLTWRLGPSRPGEESRDLEGRGTILLMRADVGWAVLPEGTPRH